MCTVLFITEKLQIYFPPSLPPFQMRLLMTKLKEQLEAKGRELNAFKLKHNIRFGNEDKSGDKPESSDTSKTSGVLVS